MELEHDTGRISLESTLLTPQARSATEAEGALRACLVVIVGGEIGRRVALEASETVIGRTSSADLQLDLDSVSRTHAVVARTPRGFLLRDRGSTNGTFVNDQPVRERALKDGDQIRIGRAMLKFLTSRNVEAQYHEEIYRLMTLDGLTQVYNRRYFHEALAREFSRSRRYKHPFTLVVLDVDHFKQINDRFGHQAGDAVLRRVACAIQGKVRMNDVVARLGGEEFGLLSPETRRAGGAALAEKLRRAIESERFGHEGVVFQVTASFGVAEFDSGLADGSALLKLADERLYEAKRSGRNRVC